mgnify:CR=1 FL=1
MIPHCSSIIPPKLVLHFKHHIAFIYTFIIPTPHILLVFSTKLFQRFSTEFHFLFLVFRNKLCHPPSRKLSKTSRIIDTSIAISFRRSKGICTVFLGRSNSPKSKAFFCKKTNNYFGNASFIFSYSSICLLQ